MFPMPEYAQRSTGISGCSFAWPGASTGAAAAAFAASDRSATW